MDPNKQTFSSELAGSCQAEPGDELTNHELDQDILDGDLLDTVLIPPSGKTVLPETFSAERSRNSLGQKDKTVFLRTPDGSRWDSWKCLEESIHRVGTGIIPPIVSNIQLTHKLSQNFTKTDSRDSPRRLGAVYTPKSLADWVAQQLLIHLPPSDDSPPLILDPACGDGALLAAIQRYGGNSYRVAGFDIDPKAIRSAVEVLGPTARLEVIDALLDDVEKTLPQTPDAIIANPPWGAELNCHRDALKNMGYEMAHGQFDTYELFLERYLRLLSDGGILAFIVPDSIFLPDHMPVRRLLTKRSQLLLIARLGEGFFPGVCRGASVLIFRVGMPHSEHQVQCFRLTAPIRREVLNGNRSIDVSQLEFAHNVPQARFTEHSRYEFDIDVRSSDLPVLKHLNVQAIPWSEWLEIGRGIELGKSGSVLICPRCSTVRPLPHSGQAVCANCKFLLTEGEVSASSIIRSNTDKLPDKMWSPLIVGEDVDRYQVNASRLIQNGLLGINYKNPRVFAQRKLLVRKTGLGLKAAIDNSGALTTQVVFHFIPRASAPSFLLNYIQGVLCSRVMLAYHLRRSGEMEWRSHPYVTLKTLLTLPVPHPGVEGSHNWQQAVAISEAVRQRQSHIEPTDDSDLQIDRLVAGLYGLTNEDCRWVLNVLNDAQTLEPIATLRISDQDRLFPVRVG